MSTASDDVSSSTKITVKHQPVDIDNEPIIWDGNPAHLPGKLFEFGEFITREGHFQPLIQERIVISGKNTIIESLFCVPFVKNQMTDKVDGYSFKEPCPPVHDRIAAFDALQAAKLKPGPPYDKSAHSSIPEAFKSDTVMNKFVIQDALREFAMCLGNIIANGTKRQSMLQAAKYDGFVLLQNLRNEANKAKPQDISLVNKEVHNFIHTGLKGDLTRASFDAHMKSYRKIVQNQDPASRLDAAGVVQMMVQIMHLDPAIRQEYKITVITEKPDPDDIDANMDLIDELLRSREVEAQLDDLTTNAGKHTAFVASAIGKSSALSPDLGTSLVQAVQSKDRKAILEALVSAGVDPVKDLKIKTKKKNERKPGAPAGDIPRDSDGKPSRFVAGKMEPCACAGAGAPGGVNDQGHHLYKDCTLKDHKVRKAAGAKLTKAPDQSSQVVELEEGLTEDEVSVRLNSFFDAIESSDHSSLVSTSLDTADLIRNDDGEDDYDLDALIDCDVNLTDAYITATVSCVLGIPPLAATTIIHSFNRGPSEPEPDHVVTGGRENTNEERGPAIINAVDSGATASVPAVGSEAESGLPNSPVSRRWEGVRVMIYPFMGGVRTSTTPTTRHTDLRRASLPSRSRPSPATASTAAPPATTARLSATATSPPP